MDIFNTIAKEAQRQRASVNLIASENAVSDNVLRAMGSVLTNKYAEGYPGARWYGGCKFTDEIEAYAIEKAKKLFGAEHANVQPHSGTSANIAAYMTLLEPGDKVLAFNLSHGGHLSHGAAFNISGKFYKFVHYGVNRETGLIDVDEIHRLFKEHRDIKLMIAGASSYPRTIDFAQLAGIAREYGAMFMADIAHISGLVAAGLHPSPVGVADMVTMSTHKTIRGPRGGMVLCPEKHRKKLDRAVFPGSQGGPLEHVIAAKAVMLEEASKPEFKAYIAEVLASAKALTKALTDINPTRYRVISGGTDNHMVMVDVTGGLLSSPSGGGGESGHSREGGNPAPAASTATGLTGKSAEDLLGSQNIYVNKNFIPYDPLPNTVTSGLRLGTPMLVTQGARASDMPRIAELVDAALSGKDVRADVAAFMERLGG